MTMITGFRLKEGGFLQADILLTSPKSTCLPPSQIPSFSDNGAGSHLLGDDIVTGLCQKIVIANDHLAVAFAGDVSKIQKAVKLIESLAAEFQKLTGHRLMDALLADEELKRAELSAIVLGVEDDAIHIASFGAEFGFSNDHFELWVGGSGSKQAITHYEGYPSHAFEVPEEDIVVQGTCMALDQFAHYLIEEFESQFKAKTIADLFGGGYEVVAFHGGKFHKISDVVYAYAEAQIDAEGILQVEIPKFLLKSTYEGDDLKVRSLEIHYDEDDEKYKTSNDRTFVIAPITRAHETSVETDCNDLDFLGEFLCYLIKVNCPYGSFILPFIRKYNMRLGFAAKAFIVMPLKENTQLVYLPIFQDELRDHIMNYMRKLNALNRP